MSNPYAKIVSPLLQSMALTGGANLFSQAAGHGELSTPTKLLTLAGGFLARSPKGSAGHRALGNLVGRYRPSVTAQTGRMVGPGTLATYVGWRHKDMYGGSLANPDTIDSLVRERGSAFVNSLLDDVQSNPRFSTIDNFMQENKSDLNQLRNQISRNIQKLRG